MLYNRQYIRLGRDPVIIGKVVIAHFVLEDKFDRHFFRLRADITDLDRSADKAIPTCAQLVSEAVPLEKLFGQPRDVQRRGRRAVWEEGRRDDGSVGW